LIVCLAGAAIGLLFAINAYILLKPVPGAEQPAAVRAVLFYLPAVWTFGAVLSALFLCLWQARGSLRRLRAGASRKPASRTASSHFSADRRRFLRAG